MIAIHLNDNSFAQGWINYCSQKNIPFKRVNCYDDNIIEQLKDCSALLWHYHHADFKDSIVARQILYAIEHSGTLVFPDFKTAWHFDDKVGQKYLFEALDLPSVKAHAFYSKQLALNWVNNANFPKVFKLRKGAGSHCVELVKSKESAVKLINKSFGAGHSIYKPLNIFYDRYMSFIRGKETFLGLIKAIGRVFIKPLFFRYASKERGYVYFQDFVDNNSSDIRVIIIGKFAFFIRRGNRPGDFRASGGGFISYEPDKDVMKCVYQAFLINKKIKSQCIAFDFLIDADGGPRFVEISYGFDAPAYDQCLGYWDEELNWIKGKPDFHGWIIEQVLEITNNG
jgi:hypothetical protein